MNQLDWARKEIEIAMKKENLNYQPLIGFNKKVCDILDNLHIQNDRRPKRFQNPFDYGCGCYESAFKAFSSLCEDGHSGMSFGFTKNILERLMDGRPLTPIYDIPENWSPPSRGNSLYTTYQCSRLSSLFKDVYKDGRVVYSDINRIIGVSPSGGCFHAGYLRDFVDKDYPITMPYSGTKEPFYVYTEDYISDPKNGDFDTVALLYMKTPEGEKVEINKYLGDLGNGFEEISYEEFLKRKESHENLMKERGTK